MSEKLKITQNEFIGVCLFFIVLGLFMGGYFGYLLISGYKSPELSLQKHKINKFIFNQQVINSLIGNGLITYEGDWSDESNTIISISYYENKTLTEKIICNPFENLQMKGGVTT